MSRSSRPEHDYIERVTALTTQLHALATAKHWRQKDLLALLLALGGLT